MGASGLHLTLGGLTAVLGLLGSISALWRFLLKPILDGMKDSQRSTDRWRAAIDIRVTLLEQGAPEEVAKLRKELLNGD